MHHDHVGGHHGDANQACLHPEGIALQRRVCQLHQQHECCEHCAQNVALHTASQSITPPLQCLAWCLHDCPHPLSVRTMAEVHLCQAGHSAVLRLIFCAEQCSMQGLGSWHALTLRCCWACHATKAASRAGSRKMSQKGCCGERLR